MTLYYILAYSHISAFVAGICIYAFFQDREQWYWWAFPAVILTSLLMGLIWPFWLLIELVTAMRKK